MKFKFFLFSLLSVIMSCDPKEDLPLSENTVQISNQYWEITQKDALVQNDKFPEWAYIYAKLDGADGSFLYLDMPVPLPFAGDEIQTVQGNVVYYSSSSLDSKKFRGSGTIDIIKFDSIAKTIQLRFEAKIEDHGETKWVQSGALKEINYTLIPCSCNPQPFEYQIEAGQGDWTPLCNGIYLFGEQVNWSFYNQKIGSNEMSRIFFILPWGLSEGIHTFTPQDSSIVTYYSTNESREWVLESGQINVENNDFADPMQKGTLNAVFHHPDNINQKFQIEQASFKARLGY